MAFAEPECPSVETLLAFVGGYLPEAEAPAIEAHLAGCDLCDAVLAEAGRALVSDDDRAEEDALVFAAPAPAPKPVRALPAVGERVGRYLLMEVLGRGAMGIVFSAYDPELDRRVAVKLVRTGGDLGASDPELDARLMGEAQAMARMSHPNVVAVHDIGAVAGGIYLAMELVAGETMRSWLATEPRPWRAILERMVQAGEGLAAAHAVGIVHRDFKPDNILVAASGRVLVTDFGLARVALREPGPLTSELTSSDLRRTRAGALVGTPAYMAPEQLEGRDIDPRVDVFAFGVVLYEALYRQRPYPGATLGELRASLLAGAPSEPPASKVPAWVRRVVMRALAADPAARFASMDALLRALRADPRRLALRIAVPLASLAVVAGTVGAVWHLTTAAARGCRDGAAAAEAVWSGELRAAAEAAFLASGRPFAAEAFAAASRELESHLAAWQDARVEACDATHELGAQSEDLLDLRLHCLDQRLDEARALTEALRHADAGVVENAPEAAARLPEPSICGETARLLARVPPPADPDAAALVARVDGLVAHAEAATLTGAWQSGKTAAEEAVALARRAGHAPTEGEALIALADATAGLGEAAAAQKLYEQALGFGIRGGDDRVAARAALGSVSSLAIVMHEAGPALSWAAIAEAEIARLGGDETLAAELLVQRGAIFHATLDGDKAIPELERAVALQDKNGGPALVRARTMITLAELYQLGERYADAIALFRRALELARGTLGAGHPLTVSIEQQLGNCLGSAGHYAESERVLLESEVALTALYPADHSDIATGLLMRAGALNGLGRLDEALALEERAIAMLRRLFKDRLAVVVLAEALVADTHLRAGRGEDALASAERGAALAKVHMPDNGIAALDQIIMKGHALELLGRYDEARALMADAEPRVRKDIGGGTELAMTLDLLGRDLVRRGLPVAAVKLHAEALAMLEEHYGKASLELSRTLRDLGLAELAAGQRSEARATFDRALELLASEPSDPLTRAEVQAGLARALAGTDAARARELEVEAAAIARASPYPRGSKLLESLPLP